MHQKRPHQSTRLDTRRPFTRAAAIAAGIGPAALRSTRYRRIFRGVYIEASVVETPYIRAMAALAIMPDGAFASHMSAARIWELPVPTHADEHVGVSRPGDRRRRPGIRCHVAPAAVRVVERGGVPVSSPVDTFIALGAILGLVDLVCVGDAMVRRELTTPRDLLAACASSSAPGAGRAAWAAAYVRAGVDSPMETRVRMLVVLAGLPEPEVNIVLRADDGDIMAQIDLGYPELKLGIQYDGRLHAEDTQTWERDLERREGLDRIGWRLIVVTSRGIYKQPGVTLDRIHRALRERGAKGLPRQLGDGWRAHFPGWG